MSRIFIALAVTALLAGCDGENPFTETGTDGGGETPVGVDGETRTAAQSIVRYEEKNENGGGFAEEINYDSATDTFSVNNLAFDGEDAYTRDSDVPTLGPNGAYAVYEADVTVPDFLDTDNVPQIVPYRAVVGVSQASVNGEPRTSFAIVRTGGYDDYGFGGFVYQREGSVVMPTTGQARFDGDYAGIRIFNGSGGLEYTEADMRMELDFDDPTDAVAGVKGLIYNRVAYAIDGTLVASSGQGELTPEGILPLPNISFVLDGENGNAAANGELTGDLAGNSYFDADGNEVAYESGTYYAILAGDTTQPDGGEIVGVIVIESTDPRLEGVTAQETGGFILYRDETLIP